jgi:hypothetical protein
MSDLRYRVFRASMPIATLWSEVTDFARDVVERLNELVTTDRVADEAITPSKLAAVPVVSVRRTTAQSIPSGALTAIVFDTIDFNVGDSFEVDSANSRIVVTREGIYDASVRASFTPSVGVAANSVLVSSVCVNGSEVSSGALLAVLNGNVVVTARATLHLRESDRVDIRVFQSTGNAQSTHTPNNINPQLQISYVGAA